MTLLINFTGLIQDIFGLIFVFPAPLATSSVAHKFSKMEWRYNKDHQNYSLEEELFFRLGNLG